jgi:hypothetical protein
MTNIAYTRSERRVFEALSSPQKIQDFLDSLPINFQETMLSPRQVLKQRRAHCLEGALLAAAALQYHGQPPLVVDLLADNTDEDHVIAVFKQYGRLGAISKTNHIVLRYREPIYKTLRELVVSYFHEYFTHDGKKTLRRFSRPVNLSRFDQQGWQTSMADLWYIDHYLDTVPHYELLRPRQIQRLRRAHPIEIRAGKLVEWRRTAAG